MSLIDDAKDLAKQAGSKVADTARDIKDKATDKASDLVDKAGDAPGIRPGTSAMV